MWGAAWGAARGARGVPRWGCWPQRSSGRSQQGPPCAHLRAVWKALWALDVCLYTVGLVATGALIVGQVLLRRRMLVPWLLHACLVVAKQLGHLTAVVTYSNQVLP